MKKNNFDGAGSLELVKVNGSRFAAEVVKGNARVNLTQMAKPFGESCRPSKWLRTDEAQRYIAAIARDQKCPLADLVEVRNGGVPGTNGTWCRDYRIALRFAQWLSPEFSIKVDEAILGLLAGSPRRLVPSAAAEAQRAQAPTNPQALGRLPIPRERSAELGEFYSELRKWVLKEDEAAVAELAGVSRGHVAEVLAGRKAGYGVLCLLVEYATENRAAGRMRVVRSAARRAEQVEELRLDFMAAGCDRGATGASADKLTSKHVGTEADMRPAGAGDQRAQAAGSACPEVVLRPEGRRTAGSHETDMRRGRPAANGAAPAETQAASRGTEAGASGRVALLRKGASAAGTQDVTDGVIDFNGEED